MLYLVLDVEIFFRHASSEGRENFKHLEPLDYGISPDRVFIVLKESGNQNMCLRNLIGSSEFFVQADW